MGLFGKLKSAKKVMETVPQVKEPWHLVLFIVNIILPGIGTLIGACMGDAKGTAYLVGFLQLLLSPIVIGWLWSILWGYFMFDKKAMKKVVKKGVEVVSK